MSPIGVTGDLSTLPQQLRVGAAVGPAVAGFVHDLAGTYTPPFGMAPVVIAASYALFLAGSAPRARAGPASRMPKWYPRAS